MRNFSSKVFVSILFVVLCMGRTALAEGDVRQIIVSGEGAVSVEPDFALIKLSVHRNGDTAALALEQMSAAAQTVIDRLLAAGIAEVDIRTTDLRLNQVIQISLESDEHSDPVFAANTTVLVKVRELDQLGLLLAASVGDGVNRFSGLSFQVSDRQPHLSIARDRAIADAVLRASQYAQAAELTLGEVLEIRESSVLSYDGYETHEMGGLIDESPVPFMASELKISASVQVTFAIAD